MVFQSRKLKVNKKFEPCSADDGDEIYPNGIFEFNITKLLIFIKANPHLFKSQEVEVKSIRKFSSSNMSESAMEVANIAEPIILAEIAPDQFNVIDGNHRLERAYREGVRRILAFKVYAEQHVAFLTSVSAYQDYVDYWNSKIDNYNLEKKLMRL